MGVIHPFGAPEREGGGNTGKEGNPFGGVGGIELK